MAGKVFITGSSRGIGAALRLEFEREGWIVGGGGREACNVLDKEVLGRVAYQFGIPDIVICNAGVIGQGAAWNAPEIKSTMAVNFFGAVNTVEAFQFALREGRITFVGMGSGWGIAGAKVGFSGYCASKHALEGYFKTLATELDALWRGKHCACVFDPGVVNTDLNPSSKRNEFPMPAVVASRAVPLLVELGNKDNGRRVTLDG